MTEGELIQRCQAGDPEAVTQLFLLYQEKIFRLAYLVTRNRQDAQDVTQETFIRLVRAIQTYDAEKGSLETWLYAIAVNLARDLLRRRRFIFPWHLLDREQHISSRSQEPERLSLAREWQEAIWEAVNALEEKQRLAVILRYYLDLSCAEIAQVLSCPEGTVHSRLYYARLALEKRLRQQERAEGWSLSSIWS